MQHNNILKYLKETLGNIPSDWLNLTTHRLDIYNESEAKTEFLEKFEILYKQKDSTTTSLSQLPTAYDYIRLGHPLSCVLEWTVAKSNDLDPSHVICFGSKMTPILSILRKNSLDNKNTRIVYEDSLPSDKDMDILRKVYEYQFDVIHSEDLDQTKPFNGSTIYITQRENIDPLDIDVAVDFHLNELHNLGSILVVHGSHNPNYISEIQHVRRRETIAMTPTDCLTVLKAITHGTDVENTDIAYQDQKQDVSQIVKDITGSNTQVIVGSSGLSVQYAILMGLIHRAKEQYPDKDIKIVVPPNCYGGTNDQARRVAACIESVEIVDLPVDGKNDMVNSVHVVLDQIAKEDAVPYVIAEIPTNPRVEVPDLEQLRDALSKERSTNEGKAAVSPVFILDQTFCPNVRFVGDEDILADIQTISFASGSKFPSGGKCTAGYCVGNSKSTELIDIIGEHLALCDNEATPLQLSILAEQMPSMLQRIEDAYNNTREFVTYVQSVLPLARINFVSETIAQQGFTPSVFSLDLPTKGNTEAEREYYKRDLNLKLIHLMINEIPDESKFCVSYGQLKGCYWTVPATSTQGTTKEGDKDYIVRASLSPDLDMERHKKVFKEFVDSLM